MSRSAGIALLALVAPAVTVASAFMLPRPTALATSNYRGRAVPATLGLALAAGLLVSCLAVFSIAGWLGGHGRTALAGAPALAMLAGAIVVAGAGLYDDLSEEAARGLIGHLRELARGRPTSGGLKLIAAFAAAGLVVVVRPSGPAQAIVGIPVIAGCANVWNLLDLRPGRSLKYFVPAAAVLVVAGFRTQYALIGVPTLASALATLPIDLSERAMLGDTGANLLGFVAGTGLYVNLSFWGLVAALAVILGLHVVSETVTLSKVIRAVPPLRWFDDLGRIRTGEGSAGPTSAEHPQEP
jgi:UDP-GlcNAc:undecaprenyl-phosphate GlcNAc-1-phosphate transferase